MSRTGGGKASDGSPGSGDSGTADSLPRLPPEGTEPARLLAISGRVVQQVAVDDVVTDAVTAIDPDVIIATNPDIDVVVPHLSGVVDRPVLRPGRGVRVTAEPVADGAAVVVVPPSPNELPSSPEALLEADTAGSGGGATSEDMPRIVLVTAHLSLEVDPPRRQTTLRGTESYLDALGESWRDDSVTHVSTALRPGYTATCPAPDRGETLTVHGLGTSEAHLGAAAETTSADLATLAVYPNGAVAADAVSPDTFGLRGLTGVGETRARQLREAGLTSRDAVAAAAVPDLCEVPTLGRETATRIQAAARAVADGEVVATGDGSLPSGDPVFIDIETDGLTASTAWLIGVLDGDAEDGRYLAFRQRDPAAPGEHLRGFMTWLTGSAAGRPVVAWNGYGFDFDVIREQLLQHLPEYVDEWDDRYCFDPLYWAKDQGNAALPGRTNALERVAEPLGWEPTTTGLDGKTVAESYVAWRHRVETADDPGAVPEPDWERLEAYCEDDVRALATVYDALAEAARREPEAYTRAPNRTDDSSQGSLSEFT